MNDFVPSPPRDGNSTTRTTEQTAIATQPELLERITVRTDVFGGKPIIRDIRIAIEHVLGMLAAGDTVETILDEYPDLTPEDIQPACCSPICHWPANTSMNESRFGKPHEISPRHLCRVPRHARATGRPWSRCPYRTLGEYRLGPCREHGGGFATNSGRPRLGSRVRVERVQTPVTADRERGSDRPVD